MRACSVVSLVAMGVVLGCVRLWAIKSTGVVFMSYFLLEAVLLRK